MIEQLKRQLKNAYHGFTGAPRVEADFIEELKIATEAQDHERVKQIEDSLTPEQWKELHESAMNYKSSNFYTNLLTLLMATFKAALVFYAFWYTFNKGNFMLLAAYLTLDMYMTWRLQLPKSYRLYTVIASYLPIAIYLITYSH